MNVACLSSVYYPIINCNDKNYKPKLYRGSCETSFKKRYSNCKKSFNVPLYIDKHDTKLPTEYWSLKTKQLSPLIPWKLKRYTSPITQLHNAVTYALQRS